MYIYIYTYVYIYIYTYSHVERESERGEKKRIVHLAVRPPGAEKKRYENKMHITFFLQPSPPVGEPAEPPRRAPATNPGSWEEQEIRLKEKILVHLSPPPGGVFIYINIYIDILNCFYFIILLFFVCVFFGVFGHV